MATLPDVTVTSDEFISLNSETGIAVGAAMQIQLKGVTWVYLVQSVAQPANTVTDGSLLSNMSDPYATAAVLAGGEEVWCRASLPNRTSKLSVQEA